MFDDVLMLAPAEYNAYVIACLETQFGAEYPDAADFVADVLAAIGASRPAPPGRLIPF